MSKQYCHETQDLMILTLELNWVSIKEMKEVRLLNAALLVAKRCVRVLLE